MNEPSLTQLYQREVNPEEEVDRSVGRAGRRRRRRQQ